MTDQVLVIDVGTSGVRAATVDPTGAVDHVTYREVLPSTPFEGFVEIDAAALAAAVLAVANQTLDRSGPVAGVAIANQRASTIVWDRATGEPVGPGVGWQDVRTVGMCMALAAQGIRVAPNASATKAAFLMDMADPDRTADLCFGTVDTWVAWTLSEGTAHVTDMSNAAVTDLTTSDGAGWGGPALEALRIPEASLPKIVDSAGRCGAATALDGSPPILAILGDQQASLVGQRATTPGLAKVTFGTGGMLDVTLGIDRPSFDKRGPDGGTFPIVAWRLDGTNTWGVEAAMLSAGTNVEWLRDGLGLISDASESAEVAAACDDAGEVVFVPAPMGLGAPYWDFGARGTFVGISGGTGRAEMVRAVLEGVAHRGADLIEAAEADTGLRLEGVRVDGGMSANPVFVQALADAAARPIEISPEREATTAGAGLMAGMALGWFDDPAELASGWRPERVVEPARETDRDRWRDAVRRASGWDENLSSIDF